MIGYKYTQDIIKTGKKGTTKKASKTAASKQDKIRMPDKFTVAWK